MNECHNSQISPPRDTRDNANQTVFGLGTRITAPSRLHANSGVWLCGSFMLYRCGGSVGFTPSFPFLIGAQIVT